MGRGKKAKQPAIGKEIQQGDIRKFFPKPSNAPHPNNPNNEVNATVVEEPRHPTTAAAQHHVEHAPSDAVNNQQRFSLPLNSILQKMDAIPQEYNEKEAIPELTLHLNQEQLAAAQSDVDSDVLVIAGAGTGKTTCMLARVHHLATQGVELSKVLLLTFTTKASKEAKFRLGKLGIPRAERITVSTCHSFCYSVLRRFYKLAGLSNFPTILSDTLSIKRIVGDCMMLLKILKRKNKLCTWLQVPMTETSMQELLDVIAERHPGIYDRSALLSLLLLRIMYRFLLNMVLISVCCCCCLQMYGYCPANCAGASQEETQSRGRG